MLVSCVTVKHFKELKNFVKSVSKHHSHVHLHMEALIIPPVQTGHEEILS